VFAHSCISSRMGEGVVFLVCLVGSGLFPSRAQLLYGMVCWQGLCVVDWALHSRLVDGFAP